MFLSSTVALGRSRQLMDRLSYFPHPAPAEASGLTWCRFSFSFFTRCLLRLLSVFTSACPSQDTCWYTSSVRSFVLLTKPLVSDSLCSLPKTWKGQLQSWTAWGVKTMSTAAFLSLVDLRPWREGDLFKDLRWQVVGAFHVRIPDPLLFPSLGAALGGMGRLVGSMGPTCNLPVKNLNLKPFDLTVSMYHFSGKVLFFLGQKEEKLAQEIFQFYCISHKSTLGIQSQ